MELGEECHNLFKHLHVCFDPVDLEKKIDQTVVTYQKQDLTSSKLEARGDRVLSLELMDCTHHHVWSPYSLLALVDRPYLLRQGYIVQN